MKSKKVKKDEIKEQKKEKGLELERTMPEPTPVVEEQRVSYKRIDCDDGEITDPDEISAFKAVQKLDIISNALLGDFNNDGEYIINKEIIKELVSQTKFITTSYNGMIFCESYANSVGLKNQFVIKIKNEENKMITASLYLLEKVDKISGKVVNTISTLIGFFASSDSIAFMEKMKKAFNIVDVSESEMKGKDDVTQNIVLRKKYLQSINKLSQKDINEAYKLAYMKKLSLIKSSKEIPPEIFKEIIEKSEKIKNYPDETKYKALNEMLDMVIENNAEKLKPIHSNIKAINLDFAEKANIANAHTVSKLISMQKTEAGKNILNAQIESQRVATTTKKNYVTVKVDSKDDTYKISKDLVPETEKNEKQDVGATANGLVETQGGKKTVKPNEKNSAKTLEIKKKIEQNQQPNASTGKPKEQKNQQTNSSSGKPKGSNKGGNNSKGTNSNGLSDSLAEIIVSTNYVEKNAVGNKKIDDIVTKHTNNSEQKKNNGAKSNKISEDINIIKVVVSKNILQSVLDLANEGKDMENVCNSATNGEELTKTLTEAKSEERIPPSSSIPEKTENEHDVTESLMGLDENNNLNSNEKSKTEHALENDNQELLTREC